MPKRRMNHPMPTDWETTFDAMPEWVALIAPDGRILRSNSAVEKLFGVSCNKIEGQVCFKLLHGTDRQPEECPQRQMMKTRSGVTAEFKSADGKRWLQVNVSPIFDTKGEIVSAVHTVRDITSAKQVEEALEESREFLSSIVENIPDMIFVKDAAELRFVRFNRAGERLLGYGREEMVGKNDHDFFPKEEAEFFTAKDREVLANRRLVEIPEERIRTRSQGERTLHTKKIPILDRDGNPRYLLGISEDITDRKRNEERLWSMAKMELAGRLAGGVAHDFNNLLTVINSYTSIVLENLPPGDPLRGDLEEIRKAGERGATLTRQLLGFGRRQPQRLETLDLNRLVSGMENVLSRLCGETIRVRIVLAPRIHPVRVDAAQVEQIVMTLVANAIDAMPMGGEITIETSDAELGAGGDSRNERVVPGDYAMLAVTDSGAGMDEATMARLFEPFFTTKGPGRGMGLGLASAHGIVQQNGGYIWAHSEPGRGTTMKVFFPRDRSIRSEGIPSSPAESFQEGSGTILVVEGDSAVRGVAERILAVAGYTVLTASNGAEAAEICKRESAIDLLLTDVVLPGKGGPALVDELVRNRPDLPVLYMSGYTQNTILRYGPLGRAAHLICKPFTAADLTAKVREILDAERS